MWNLRSALHRFCPWFLCVYWGHHGIWSRVTDMFANHKSTIMSYQKSIVSLPLWNNLCGSRAGKSAVCAQRLAKGRPRHVSQWSNGCVRAGTGYSTAAKQWSYVKILPPKVGGHSFFMKQNGYNDHTIIHTIIITHSMSIYTQQLNTNQRHLTLCTTLKTRFRGLVQQ